MLHARPSPRPDLVALAAGIGLVRGRAHEIAGGARRALALLVAARMAGPVVWIGPSWGGEALMGDGVAAFFDPGRLLLAAARTAMDALWAVEEAARSGAAPLVVAELAEPPGLTPVRRLHLAAEAGAARGTAALVLLLTPGDGGAAGVETRWRVDPAPGWAIDGRPRWRLARLRARDAPPAAWEMRQTGRGLVLAPLPPEGEPRRGATSD